MNLPVRIEDGKVIIDEGPFFLYKEFRYIKDKALKEKGFKVEMIPSKWNVYEADIYCKRLQLTFRLTHARPFAA
ncbi:hypothetical protein EII33_01870 [Bacteroides heparinolyticus]|uniref:Uncharacterized protein n=1 Tax=Prevotella heparinolytica TaxID=28113 RepID=A0A3P2AC44_9BACE|nr:hypothetical protein [Bacteroides heparinolyticus]RRD93001.1 hypothetical protein EII33_01870 [Bacteroides heparinolyticus]